MTVEPTKIRTTLERSLEREDGILRLEPAWVARTFLPPGGRLGVPGRMLDLGKRGGICERWLASTTKADNEVSVPDEGLSFLALGPDGRMTLRDAVDAAGDLILGARYASTHRGLDRLAKIFDYAYRLPYHLHQMAEHAALVGRNPKEESYYFPEGVPMGPEPDSYFGVHPSIAENKHYHILLPYLTAWDSDLILRHARGYHLVPDDGFHIPAGVLHAPGSALTIELQEDSDVLAFLQARAGGRIISKELLFKDVRPEDRRREGEGFILKLIDWEANGDTHFYEHRHTPPLLVEGSGLDGIREYWIFYNTAKFSGKKLVVPPGARHRSRENGVYSILAWRGRGRVGPHRVEGQNPALDELIVAHAAASELTVENDGTEDLVLFKFFGPDINPDVPMLRDHRQ